MKIKKSELKEIVVEELETYLSELAPCHNPKTGFFDDCDAGAVYSLIVTGKQLFLLILIS